MKNITFVIILIFLFSCNNKPSKEYTEWLQQYNDSIRQDSIYKQSVIDSLSLIAIGDIKFGMTSQEISETETGKFYGLTKNYPQTFNSLNIYSFKVNGEFYNCGSLLVNDTLYKIELTTQEVGISNLRGFLDRCAYSLNNAFKEKYGEPDFERPFPKSFDMEAGQTYHISSWEIGNKDIQVGIYHYTNGLKYKLECIIEHRVYKEIADRERLKKEAEEKAQQVNPL